MPADPGTRSPPAASQPTCARVRRRHPRPGTHDSRSRRALAIAALTFDGHRPAPDRRNTAAARRSHPRPVRRCRPQPGWRRPPGGTGRATPGPPRAGEGAWPSGRRRPSPGNGLAPGASARARQHAITLWLLPRPQALAERGGQPQHGGPLRLLAGPERLESGWWDGGEDGAFGDLRRDYFVALSPRAEWLWIFRDAEGWFLHGLFA